jgi:hypothetical protein
MSKVIIFTRNDGSMAVVHPASASADLTALAAKVVPVGTTFRIVELSSLPSERRWRNAWKRSGSSVVIDLEKAKAIREQELLRALEVEALPVEMNDALAACETVEELEAVTA